jgi:hypothetical protein
VGAAIALVLSWPLAWLQLIFCILFVWIGSHEVSSPAVMICGIVVIGEPVGDELIGWRIAE